MDEREFTIRTTGGVVQTDKAPSGTKPGDTLEGWGDLVVLLRVDFERGPPFIMLGPPKEESDF